MEKKIKYSEILKKNSQLTQSLNVNKYGIKVLSNIITSQINEILEYTLRIYGVPAIVKSGGYDNIVQDSLKYRGSDSVIIFWELCNIIDGLHFRCELLNDDQINEILEKTKAEIDLVLKNLNNSSLVLINKFTSLQFQNLNISEKKIDALGHRLNQYLENNISINMQLIDIEKVLAFVGLENSIDLRYYYSSKSLYTIEFYKAYSQYIKPFIMSANGKAKKALIFDCDNTLWKGVLGEDGFDNIEMSNATTNGVIFLEIQSLALNINKQGVLLGLCSKNNQKDVEEVIENHPDMQIKNQHLAIKKINWNDKVTNLNLIAEELNISLDSIVYVDDNIFEVNMIKELLPEVKVLQVPKILSQYPNLIRDNMSLFYNLSKTKEDKNKTLMYKEQAQRDTLKKKFINLEDYISSLNLKMKVMEDDKSIITRMAQMTQKTNQFNLTTKRYTEVDIKKFVEANNSKVLAISISDNFGNSGITGLCIINVSKAKEAAKIDTLLMSCRILGRNIEYAFVNYFMNKLKNEGILFVSASYLKTQKNGQVEDFFDRCQFELVNKSNIEKEYCLELVNYKYKDIKYVKVLSESKGQK